MVDIRLKIRMDLLMLLIFGLGAFFDVFFGMSIFFF